MKKIKFKILSVGFAVAFLFLSAGILSGCGGIMLKLESDIKQKLIASETHFVENVYAQETPKDFNSDSSENYVQNAHYYILISSEVKDDIAQIKLGSVVYIKGEEVTTKLLGTNTIKRKAFLKEDQKLYISSLLMFFNTGNDGNLMLAFPKNNYKDIKIEVYKDNNQLNIAPKSMMAETLSKVDDKALKYNFKIDNPNGKVFVEMKEGDQSLLPTAPVLIEVVANPSKSNQSRSHKFETPETVADIEGMGVVITPGSNAGLAYTKGSPANHTLIYNFYVPQVGTKTLTIYFFNTK